MNDGNANAKPNIQIVNTDASTVMNQVNSMSGMGRDRGATPRMVQTGHGGNYRAFT